MRMYRKAGFEVFAETEEEYIMLLHLRWPMSAYQVQKTQGQFCQ